MAQFAERDDMLSAGRVVNDVSDGAISHIREARQDDDMTAAAQKSDADLHGAIFAEFVQNHLLEQTAGRLSAFNRHAEDARPIKGDDLICILRDVLS